MSQPPVDNTSPTSAPDSPDAPRLVSRITRKRHAPVAPPTPVAPTPVAPTPVAHTAVVPRPVLNPVIPSPSPRLPVIPREGSNINPETIQPIPLPTEDIDDIRARTILSKTKKQIDNGALSEDDIAYVLSYYFHCTNMYYQYVPALNRFEPHSYTEKYGLPTKYYSLDYFYINYPVKVIYDADLPVLFTVPFRNFEGVEERRMVLNLFPQIPIERYLYDNFTDDIKRGVELFWHHIYKVLCSKNDKLFKFNRYWIIHVLNRRRTLVAIYNSSSGGTGKSMVYNMLMRIIGERHSMIDDRGIVVSSRFNAPLANKILILLEEAPCEGKARYIDLGNNLKNIIDGPTLPLEHKNKDRTDITVRNYINLVINTNYTKGAIKFDKDSEGERRYCFNDIDNKYAYREGQPIHKWLQKIIPYFGNPAEEAHNPELRAKRDLVAGAIYNYCLEAFEKDEEIQKFQFPNNIPITKTQIRVMGRDKLQQLFFALFVECNIFQLDINVRADSIFYVAKIVIDVFDLDIEFDYKNKKAFYDDVKKIFGNFYVIPNQKASLFRTSYNELCNYFIMFDNDYADRIHNVEMRTRRECYELLEEHDELYKYYADNFKQKETKKDTDTIFEKRWIALEEEVGDLLEEEEEVIVQPVEEVQPEKEKEKEEEEVQTEKEKEKEEEEEEEIVYEDEDGNVISAEEYQRLMAEEQKATKKPNADFTGEKKKFDQ